MDKAEEALRDYMRAQVNPAWMEAADQPIDEWDWQIRMQVIHFVHGFKAGVEAGQEAAMKAIELAGQVWHN